MSETLLSSRNLAFELYEVLDAEALTQRERFAEHNRETFDAALAAHGEDRDGDRPHPRGAAGIHQRSVHAVTIFFSSRRWKKPITASRMRCLKRSQPVGLSMIEAW